MGISRLDNFLKSVRGNTLYVDPNSLDSTDSVENQGNSPTRPFKTIQRALVEAARFSYQVGSNNDRFNKTTIILQPGEHIVDNRPGVIVNDDGSYRTRDGVNPYTDYGEFDLNTNFNISSNNNILYKLNSIHGGVIVPRGTSIVGSDIRKTVIRPKYIPNPENTNIERSAIFRVTGGCFLYGFSILDADPNGTCYKDYTLSEFVPNFSHHKLTAFEYADGVNLVEIDDDFISNFESSKTDLEMYYDKISVAYGQNSGREIISSRNDIQPVVDEYRIVGSRGEEVEISSISASGTTVTVTLSEALEELSANSPIQISGVNSSNIGDIYDGQYVISSVISNTQFTYTSIVTNVDTSPNVGSATLSFSVDTVTSASPYIFNVSLRSVYGMCGMHADGSKASGFKSMVVAQFTGIGLQKDDNAFVKYNSATGEYDRFPDVTNIHSDSFALFKPEYQNYHVKASNNAFIQLVSIFAIGYAEHFVVESGGDQSITNSNSNFGAKSLVARGFRDESFPKDDLGYITHIVSPQKINSTEISVEFSAIDVGLTTSASSGAGTTTKLYLYNENNEDNPPNVVIDGFRIGAKDGEILYTQISQSGVTSTYSCRVTMPESDLSKEKVYTVARENNDTENSISATGVITLETNHEFIAGEKVRVFSDNGHLPDGLSNNKIYYVIDSTIDTGIGSTEIKLAATFGNAFTDTPIIPNKTGGIVRIKSRVSDKVVGDIGHPVQYDSGVGNWYINVSSTDNTIYNIINNVGISGLGEATPRTYIKRINDNRNLVDSIYKFRYVIPKDSSILARPPLDGFIIQESNSSGLTDAEQDYYYSLESSPVTLSNSTQVRNPGFISNAEWSSNVATIYTELPHNLSVGSEVRISNVTSGLNTTTDQEKGYNGVFTVTSIPSSKEFAYSLVGDPGSFQSDTTIRDLNLPTYSQKTLPINYQIYRYIEIQPYIQNKQDGIYQLIVINNSNRPNIDPFQNVSLSQPVQYLYPQLNRDNPSADPDSSKSFALYNPIGQVVINDPENSLTKETVEKTINDLKIGFGVTSIISSSGTAHTIFTEIDHGLSGITSVSIVSSGSDYLGAANYYAAELVGFAGSTTGSGANARISIDGSGQLSEIVIMDPGSVYGIGNTLQVIPAAGIGTTTGFIPAVIQVESIANDIGTIIEISGLSAQHTNYNNLYKVVGFTSTSNEIVVSSASSVSGFSTTILELGENTSVYTGKVLTVSGVTYNNETGVGIVTFTDSHGLNVDNSILFTGFDENFLNKTAYVSRNRSLLSVDVDFGISETSLSTSGTVEGYIRGYSDRSGNLSRDNDITSGRNIVQYGGIQSKILTQLLSNSTAPNELEILDAYSLGFRLGDYLQVDKELFRIKSTVGPTSNTVEVFRSILGSPRQSHDANSVVKKIKVVPVEFRRNSIIRASGHTFEYLGYGPGNYSTAFPERQDRVLSPQEELIAQSTKENGGIVIFTAMNSDGDFYTGNKKVNSSTGKEEVFDTPVPTVTGEEIDIGSFSVGFDVISPLEISVSRSLRVEGGPDGNLVSEFDGPVVFTNKLTSTSDKGIEATSLFLQGDAEVSRNLTVGISTPTSAGNYGDVVTRTEPILGENLGWVYTSDNEWKQWGLIKNIGDPLYGVGISSGGGSVGFSTLIDFVGVGVTVTVGFNTETNKSTVTVSGDPANTIGISSGGSYLGDSASLDFVGASDGFGLNLSVQYGGILGITTIVFDVPIDDIDFGTGILGKNPPTFISTSTGTRVIYENTINTTNTNYAVGVDGTSLWWSVPQNSAYSFQWYGGTTKVGELVSQSGSGQLTINGSSSKVTAKQLVSDVSTGTAPLLVTSSTQVNNLNANYLQGFISSENELENTIVRRNSSNVIQGNVTKLIHSGIGQTGGWYADIPARLGYTPFNDAGDTCTGPAIFNSTLTANGLTTIKQVSDIYKQQSTSSTIITCDFSTGPITRTESTDTTEVNIINVPTTTERALNYTVLMNTKGISVSELSNIVFKINGTALTPGTNLYWLNDLSPVGTSPGYYFFGFTILRIGSNWEVLGTFAPYGN
jgi:hypothetical protein